MARGRTERPRRGYAPPRSAPRVPDFDEVEIQAADGHSLRAAVRDVKRPKGIAVLAHAMMARRTEFERGEGLASFLAERGWRTVAFDFRGHGDSGPGAAAGAAWTYDDLVRRDVPAVIDSARARSGGLPVVVVGHSLGGHVALAAQGTGALHADAIVTFAANVWMRRHEPSGARWAVKRGALALMRAVVGRHGYLPARALRLGSDDEAAAYVRDLLRFAEADRFTSRDEADDYLSGFARIRVPVLGIVSDGDRLNCHPECGARFVAGAARAEVDRVRRADDGSPAPGHMQLVTSAAAKSAWARAEAFLAGVT